MSCKHICIYIYIYIYKCHERRPNSSNGGPRIRFTANSEQAAPPQVVQTALAVLKATRRDNLKYASEGI